MDVLRLTTFFFASLNDRKNVEGIMPNEFTAIIEKDGDWYIVYIFRPFWTDVVITSLHFDTGLSHHC